MAPPRPEFEPFLVKATSQGHLILSPDGLLNLWRVNGQPGALTLVDYPEAGPGVMLFGKLLRVATGSDPRPAPVNVAAHLREVTETFRTLGIQGMPMLHMVLRSY